MDDLDRLRGKRDRLWDEMNERVDAVNRARRKVRYESRKYRAAWDAWVQAALKYDRAMEEAEKGEQAI